MKEFAASVLVGVFITIIYITIHDRGMNDAYEEMKQYPSAMDVYAGKTTLQYTIVDGVKIDSIVVFK